MKTSEEMTADKVEIAWISPQISKSHWPLYTDRARAKDKGGAWVFLNYLGDEDFQYCVNFLFEMSNNVAEYEALAIGLHMARRVNAQYMKMFVDSQLVAQQL